MHYIGVDLAWGERNPTGLAVLDDTGALVHLSAVRTDADIVAALTPYTGDCALAIDAPLIVTNPAGNRPCERALNADFRAFEAGTHPANTSRPWFADGTRGARVATALGVGVCDALEVYPHAATVALFGLDRTLKYKAKPGRTLESRRAVLLQLLSLVESLREADPALDTGDSGEWARLRTAVGAATRAADLRRAEDPVDAVLCAYVALFARRRPADTAQYGDPATGVIVTPRLGAR